MKKLSAALIFLGLWFGLFSAVLAQQSSVGPEAIVCNQVYEVSQGATALAKIVSNATGKQISICGWTFNSGAAASTAQLKTGTGTNCGTSTASLTPSISLPINGLYWDHIPFAFVSLPQGTDLCLVTTGTGPTQVMVYYGIY